MRRDGDVRTAPKSAFDELDVLPVDVRFVGIGDRLGLEARALHDAQVGCERQQALEVVRRPVQVRLEHGPDRVMARVAEALVDAQRHLDVLRLLHVDAEERPERLGTGDEPLDVGVGDLLVDGEAEVRQLERDVCLQLLGDEPLDDGLVLGRDGSGTRCVGSRLAKQRRVRVEPRLVQLPEHADARVERLACDEPRCADAPTVALDEVLQPRALGRMEDCGSRKRREVCAKVGHAP